MKKQAKQDLLTAVSEKKEELHPAQGKMFSKLPKWQWYIVTMLIQTHPDNSLKFTTWGFQAKYLSIST